LPGVTTVTDAFHIKDMVLCVCLCVCVCVCLI
jgi:hypothetical protein